MQIENGAIAAARDEAVAGMNRLFAKVDRDVCAALVPVQARAKELDAQIIEAQEQLEHVQRERERYLERFKSLTLCFNGTRHMSSLGSAHDVEEGLGAPEQPEVDGRATSTEASEMAGDIGTLDDRSPAKQGTPRIGDSPLPNRRAEPEAPAAVEPCTPASKDPPASERSNPPTLIPSAARSPPDGLASTPAAGTKRPLPVEPSTELSAKQGVGRSIFATPSPAACGGSEPFEIVGPARSVPPVV
mmetsp:Transcript_48686/g.149772  ORF Transcript_48686/g.149772 Transcript_48686/m.149772 type:complete len:245 (-) Transcript_48686:83-817(-)